MSSHPNANDGMHVIADIHSTAASKAWILLAKRVAIIGFRTVLPSVPRTGPSTLPLHFI